jgi:hypothetical protein
MRKNEGNFVIDENSRESKNLVYTKIKGTFNNGNKVANYFRNIIQKLSLEIHIIKLLYFLVYFFGFI